jgi:hypothetical protein
MPANLTLICQLKRGGSASAEPASPPGLPTLKPLHRRADARPDSSTNPDGALFDYFGIQLVAGKDRPVAAVTRLLEPGMDRDRWWIRADPVYCEADRDSVVMVADLSRDLSARERQELTDLLSPLFAAEAMDLQAGPDGWFIAAPVDSAVTTSMPEAVVGNSVLPFLPGGPQGGLWRRRLNEVQMTLFEAPINQRRIAAGKQPANTLWFWGGGRLPVLPDTSPRPLTLWSDNRLAQGLAQLAGMDSRPAPAAALDWLGQAQHGDHLIVLAPELSSPVSLDAAWFAPLYAALKSRQLASLTLNPLTGIVYTITSKQARRWWVL